METERHSGRTPWLFPLFFVLVAIASFDFLMSVDYVERKDQTTEAKLEESISRTESGNAVRQAALLALLVTAGAVVFQERKRIVVRSGLAATVLLFTVWACASILWSHDAPLTIRRVAILCILLLTSLAMGARFSTDSILRFGFWAGAVTIAVGLATELALGTFQPWDPEYRFAGIMNPIFQGAHCGMTALCALALQRTSSRRFLYLVIAALALVFMLLTRSRGPIGATAVAIVVYGSLTSPGVRRAAQLGLVALVLVLPFTSARQDLLVGTHSAMLAGRSIELGYEMQGRDALWTECMKYVSRRPLLGYGYDSFWTRDVTFAVTDASGFTSQHTHNAFLDLTLGVGLPGMGVFVAIIAIAMLQLQNLFRSSGNHCYACAAALVVLYAIHNIFVSVQLAVQLQTLVVTALVMKVAFANKATDSEDAAYG